MMEQIADTVIRLTVPPDGALVLPPQQLQQLGFTPGDPLILVAAQPGQIYLQRAEAPPSSKAALQQQIQQAFQNSGYDNRDKVLDLIRAIKREIADERVTTSA